MKKLVFGLIIIMLLAGCTKKNTQDREELINLGDMDGYTLYIASPSGMIMISSGSEIKPYTVDGKIKYLEDYIDE